MRQEILKWRDRVGLGIIASVALHLTVGSALLVNLPFDLPQPEPDESVAVELVPPPEEEKPADEPAEPEAEASEKDAKQEAVAPPPPPAEMPPEAQQAEAEAPPPPEPQPEEPPPPPPPAEEQAAAEPPPPPTDQPKPEEPAPTPAPQEQAAASPSAPILDMVGQYGEEDSGPRVSSEGLAATDGSTAEADASQETVPEQDVAEASGAPPPPEGEALTGQEAPSQGLEEGTEAAAGSSVPDNIQAPSVDFRPTSSSLEGSGGSADDGKAGVLVAPVAKAATSLPTDALAEGKVKLTEAKKLFSRSDTDGLLAMRAAANTPPAVRGGKLCSTELQLQLWHMTPGYAVQYVPQYTMPPSGVQLLEEAFYSKGNWYKVHFRCEVDAKVTKVLSFSYSVGDVIPREQWTQKMIDTVSN